MKALDTFALEGNEIVLNSWYPDIPTSISGYHKITQVLCAKLIDMKLMNVRSINVSARNRFSDVAGVFLSALCITHCVIAPILLAPFVIEAILPFDRLAFLHKGILHDIMFILTLTFGISSVYFAARRGKHMPVICLTVGLLAVSFAEFFLHDLAVVRLPGTLCMIGGHLWAMRNLVISK